MFDKPSIILSLCFSPLNAKSMTIRTQKPAISPLPVNNLNAVGTLRLCVTQKTSAFFDMYKPGSMIIGFAL